MLRCIPVIFKGTVRSTLDPFFQYTNLRLCSALGQSALTPEDNISTISLKLGCIHLDDLVEEEGANFFFGKPQLRALTCVLARDLQGVACDEATLSLDIETDVQT